ncbi:MAG TPA: TolC family protein [Moheibacter sp.]|nr:TolC family protein [Moheibacter sp.]
MKKNTIYISLCLLFFSHLGTKTLAQTTDSLSYYINVAVQNNPAIKAQQFAQEAFLEKIPQAGAFQDPELSIEAYTTPMDVLGGRSLANFGVMQMFPWFGTKKAAKTEAIHQAKVQDEQSRTLVNELILQVSSQWYALLQLKEQLKNNQENKILLEQLEQLATRKYAVGANSGGMSDVLRIQLEIVELDNNIESLQSKIKAEKAIFNALLNRNADDIVHLGKEIQAIDYLFDENEILSTIEKNNPQLNIIQEQGLAYRAKAEVDRKKSYPMIGVGLQYMLIGKTQHEMFAMGNMNGDDMIMPMVTMSLPIFRKKYQAKQNEAQLWWKSSEQNYQNTLNTLKSEFYALKNQLDDAQRIIGLYEKQSTLAKTTYQLIVQEFTTGKSDLTNVIQVHRQLLDYQLKKAEATANYNTLVASIQKLTANNAQ